MVGHGGSSAGSYLADPTSPIPSQCAVIILFKSAPELVVASTLRVKNNFITQKLSFNSHVLAANFVGYWQSHTEQLCVHMHTR